MNIETIKQNVETMILVNNAQICNYVVIIYQTLILNSQKNKEQYERKTIE